MSTNNEYDDFMKLQSLYPRKNSNDFIMPIDIRRRIEHGMLSYFADEHALVMLEQREGFYKLHFRLVDTAATLPSIRGTLAAYLTYHEGRYPGLAADWLRGQGFVYKKTLLRHTATAITGNLSLEPIEKASSDEVYSMFGEYFSVVEADLPPRSLFEAEDTYCRRSPEGELLGIVYDMGQTRIVAVSPKTRGQGIGRRLYFAYAMKKVRESPDCVFHEWISPDNGSSLSMFRSLGFTRDTIMSDCYIREKLT